MTESSVPPISDPTNPGGGGVAKGRGGKEDERGEGSKSAHNTAAQ